ncbi:unnamed protein product [Brachionus calyciflorus]|uniref:Transmembrane protein n=1 Tax=Brachionus calyciflorus TaxID=104777 RepID=A0A813MB44_9BILA|nr:unnamed protein product [Brachionus calyciflorus]
MMKSLLLVIFSLSLILEIARAQSQCDTICSITPNCNSGICFISKCSEANGCFEFCLNCAGIETCSQAGLTCSPSASIAGFQFCQSQCDSLCAITPDCKSGKCSISKCSELNNCFQFCLTCSGNQTCVQSGPNCPKNTTAQYVIKYNRSNIISHNFFSLFISVFLLFLVK